MISQDWNVSMVLICHRFNELATKVKRQRMVSPGWNASMVDIHLWKLPWKYCPGHAGEKGKDRADRLAGKATLTSSFLLGRSEVLRSLRYYLRTQSQRHYTIDHLEKRGMERGSASQSSLKGRERVIVNQTKHWNCFKGNFGKTSERRDEGQMGFFRAHRNHHELKWGKLNENGFFLP